MLAPILPAPTAPVPAQIRTSIVPPPKPILPPVPPAAAPPRRETSPVFMPLLPAQVAGTPAFAPPVAPAPAPFQASAPEPIPGAPRRRFARPTSLTAGALTQVLEDAFRVPEVPNGHWPAAGNGAAQNGHAKTGFTPPPAPADQPAYQSAPRQFAPEQPLQLGATTSPFGISDAPLTSPPGALLEPVPFTFLKHDGDHFSHTDPLDDDLVPWMQPISLGQPRKN